MFLHFGGHGGIVDHGFHDALDGRQGRLDFVRDVGHEILADTLEMSQLGQIVKHQHRSTRRVLVLFERSGPQFQNALAGSGCCICLKRDLRFGHLAQSGIEGVENFGVAQHLPHRNADALRGIQPEKGSRRGVHVNHVLLRVDRHHPVAHAGENRGQALAASRRLDFGGLRSSREGTKSAAHQVETQKQADSAQNQRTRQDDPARGLEFARHSRHRHGGAHVSTGLLPAAQAERAVHHHLLLGGAEAAREADSLGGGPRDFLAL